MRWLSSIPVTESPTTPETAKFFGQSLGNNLASGRPWLDATEMIDAACDGELKAMYIVGEDPANSDPW